MNTTNPLILLIATIFTHNIALVYILGMCPFIVISKNFKTALGMGAAIIFVVTLTAIINWP
ncbi:MAG TPA: NADH:ubiquinone reductase (Na(+)-transporting) subunit E, partial [Candidatus Omnitrophica bacterium]|nr:NADH:ubiquinone reductase (Na(+)-transporting) subunit E [Candidatus Omnitrophota bacterium]